MRRVLDDGYAQTVVVAKVALLPPALGYAFDLFNFFDLKACVFSEVALDEKGHKDGPLRVGMDAATGAAFEGCEEERSACRGFQNL